MAEGGERERQGVGAERERERAMPYVAALGFGGGAWRVC